MEWTKKCYFAKTQINLSIKELNCVPEPLRMAAYDLYLGTFVGIYPNSSKFIIMKKNQMVHNCLKYII